MSNAMVNTASGLTFVAQQEEVATERAARIDQYKRELQAEKTHTDSEAVNRLKLFADGDSWFDYPLPVPSRRRRT